MSPKNSTISTKKRTVTKTGTKATKSSTKKAVEQEVVAEVKIAPRNYLYAVLLLVGGILLVFGMFQIYQLNKKENLKTSYLISSSTIENNITDINQVKQIMQEAPTSYFLYISYTGNEEVYNFEKTLKKVIDNYKLNDMFYYIDITELRKENDTYLTDIKQALNINVLERVPAIIYVHEGEILEDNILDGVGSTKLKVQDLEKLLDIYDFEEVK